MYAVLYLGPLAWIMMFHIYIDERLPFLGLEYLIGIQSSQIARRGFGICTTATPNGTLAHIMGGSELLECIIVISIV
jgi:hypothetical protein